MSCPICGEVTIHTFRPFCSKRCADIDLAKWLNGSYALPGSQREEAPMTNPSNDETEPRGALEKMSKSLWTLPPGKS